MTNRSELSRIKPLLFLLVLAIASAFAGLVLQGNDWLAGIIFLRDSVGQYQWASWLWFALAVLVSQLLVIPSGSVLMLIGGFLLGAPAATMIFSVIQLLATVLLVRLGHTSGVARLGKGLSRWSGLLENAFNTLNKVPLTLGIVLRLFPVLPSALACLLSVVFDIPLRTFLLATALVGWIRPLFFASAGALLPTLLDIAASRAQIMESVLWPAFTLFFSAVALLLFRIWFLRQGQASD